MRIERNLALIVFIVVRPYEESDLSKLVQVYKSAFAQPPWNEFWKCVTCDGEIGTEESKCLSIENNTCPRCNEPSSFVEYWSEKEIITDVQTALSQPKLIALVARTDSLVGFVYGYQIDLDKFPFLKGKVPIQMNYMDDIAVDGYCRQRGVGTKLGRCYIDQVKSQNLDGIILRTDVRNESSMALFQKLGFNPVKNNPGCIYDPEFPERIYLELLWGCSNGQ